MSARPPIVLTGIGASGGIALGKAHALHRKRIRTPRYHVARDEVETEVERLRAALRASDDQLRAVKERIEAEGATDHAAILDAHRLMLQDPAFAGEILRLIQVERFNAEWAVRRTTKRIKASFEKIDDEYFRERKQDVEYVADRVSRNLLGHSADVEASEIPDHAIVVAHDLSPADAAVLLKPGRIRGLVTDLGGKTSHTAIVARARGIPAVVGATRASELVGADDELALDGDRGVVIVRPTPSQVERFRAARERHERYELELATERDQPARTLDGHEVQLHANIEFDEEVALLDQFGARGIGLYRTEFLYLGRDRLPREEEQLAVYRRVLEQMGDRPVTIRTLDIGGDKMPSERGRKSEANPALGLRAIRYCARHPQLFHTQLRALLRAARYGNLRILFPMISGPTELREAKAALEAARADLQRAGEAVPDRVPVGIMIELPSAAQIADRLAQEADFFSIGTNDLIQYSLAIDRQNRDVAYLYRPLHLAILRMVRFVASAARARGIPVSMCGEMAGDPYYTLVLLALGVDELSMASASLPLVRRIVRASRLSEAQELLARVEDMSTAEEIETHVRSWMDERFTGILSEAPPDEERTKG